MRADGIGEIKAPPAFHAEGDGARSRGAWAEPRMIELPDDGCKHSPSCFTCPLPECIFVRKRSYRK